jgi:hypothetical protein
MTGGAWPTKRLRTAGSRALAAAAIVLLAGCRMTVADPAGQASSAEPGAPAAQPGSASSASARQAGLVVIHDPGRVTGTLHGRCRYPDAGQLPDPRCTPGSIDPAVTQANIRQTICVSGYTSKVRPSESQTERFKYHIAYPAYGTPQTEKTELDHLVALALGGSNDATNLWPENYRGLLGAHAKDRLENYLHDAVCSGRMPLKTAQETIATDWVKAYCAARLGECPAGLQ